MMEANLTGLVFLKPVFAFLIIFVVMYALLAKSKLLGEDRFVNVFVSFIFASIFVATADVTNMVLSVVPWFVVLVMLLFFIMILAGFIGKEQEIGSKGLAWGFVVVLVVMFLVSGFYTFEQDEGLRRFIQWAFSSSIFATVVLLAVAGIVGWAITRDKK